MSIATLPQSDARASQRASGSHHLRLTQLRDEERLRRLVTTGLIAVGLVMLLSALLAVLDFFLELSASARLFGWLSIVGIVVVSLCRLRPWLRFESADAAGAAERAWPEIGQRLRTSHDYASGLENTAPANPELVIALEQETEQRMTDRVIEPLGPAWPLITMVGLCFTVAITWMAVLALLPEWRISTARLLMLPMHYSQVDIEPLPESVPQGDDFIARVHVQGRPLESARIRYRISGDTEPWSEVGLRSLGSDELIDELTAVLPDRQHDFEVQIDAGPVVGPIHRIAVRIPLRMEQWTAAVEPPAYTQLPTSEGPAQGIRVPEGSRIELAGHYNRAPHDVDVTIRPATAATDPRPTIEDSVAYLAIDAGDQAMELMMTATAADSMTDESSLHIDVVPDQRPRIKFAAPQQDAEAIPTAEVHFTLEAVDDYALAKVGIRYRIDDGEEQTLWETSLQDHASAIAETTTLPLEELNLSYPQAITYYAYAVDNRQPQPHEVTSELRFLDIRPFSREYEFKESNCSGNCQGECLTLEKLIKQQREILGRTFASARQPQIVGGVGQKLASDEQELKTKTEALTAALEQKVGPMPQLNQALEAMSAAIDDLQNQAVADGQSDEEQALADLIAARQNLRKILKQCNSQSQTCRNVDQQQLDKLRKPEREQEQKEQQLSRIRDELQKLAEQQKSFCDSAQACSQSSQSSRAGQPNHPSQSAADQPSPAPSREQLVQEQQQSASRGKEIQQELADGDFGELAPQRVAQAAKSIELSGESLAAGDQDQRAIANAREAAEQLERLARHLGRRQDPDFGEKLATAQREAERLSSEQKRISESLGSESPSDHQRPAENQDQGGLLGEQQSLAQSGEELADLVSQLEADAADQQWQVQQGLIEQTTAHPPGQAAADMRQAAQHVAQGNDQSAAQSGARAANQLAKLAAGLKNVQQTLGPAQLEQLTAAEKRAAELLKDLHRANSPGEQALARARSSQFGESIGPLTIGDQELSHATRTLGDLAAGRPQTDVARDAERTEASREAFNQPPETLAEGLRRVDEILQRRIQEAILSGSLQQADGAIPPQYVDMVEEYYRTLSEDVQ